MFVLRAPSGAISSLSLPDGRFAAGGPRGPMAAATEFMSELAGWHQEPWSRQPERDCATPGRAEAKLAVGLPKQRGHAAPGA